MKWILDVNAGQANGILTSLEARSDNPSSLSEVRTVGARSLANPNRVTPQYAVLTNLDGTVDIGIPENGWALDAIENAPGLPPNWTVVDERPAGKNDSEPEA